MLFPLLCHPYLSFVKLLFKYKYDSDNGFIAWYTLYFMATTQHPPPHLFIKNLK